MSEATLIASATPVRVARPRVLRNRLNPLEAMERGFALFQATFAREAWRYYAGAAPLVLCFIPIWVLDGQIRVSDGVVLLEAAVLGAAYLLRVWMVTGYMQRIREHAFGVPALKRAPSFAQAAAIGRLLAWKAILSVGALAALPTIAGASWLYTGSQFASLEAGDDAERHSLWSCVTLASEWFGGGVLLFLMLIPLWVAVWLNGVLLAILVPQLLHSIFGVRTLLSTGMGMDALTRSSAFWLSLFAGAWAAIDPIVKCTFVAVYQHLRSRREGDDLRGLLASLPREQQKKSEMVAGGAARGGRIGAIVCLCAVLAGGFQASPARAAQALPSASAQISADSAEQARVQTLRQALHEESQRDIYRWHDADHPSPPTWFDRLLAKIGRGIDQAWAAFWKFLGRIWPRGLHLSLGNGKPGAWHLKDLRIWVGVILALTIAAGAVLFWLRRRGEAAQLSIPIPTTPLPDLSDAAVATEHSEDEWFALANRLEGQGELRLALRAAYLGLLAGLAQREWLTIRRDRTNREYLDQFARRWRRRPQAAADLRAEVPEKLRGSLRQFDRVWYGSQMPTSAAVATYCQDQRELLRHV
jgi:hypothetical protein